MERNPPRNTDRKSGCSNLHGLNAGLGRMNGDDPKPETDTPDYAELDLKERSQLNRRLRLSGRISSSAAMPGGLAKRVPSGPLDEPGSEPGHEAPDDAEK